MIVNMRNTRTAFHNAADTDMVVKTKAFFYMQPMACTTACYF